MGRTREILDIQFIHIIMGRYNMRDIELPYHRKIHIFMVGNIGWEVILVSVLETGLPGIASTRFVEKPAGGGGGSAMYF